MINKANQQASQPSNMQSSDTQSAPLQSASMQSASMQSASMQSASMQSTSIGIVRLLVTMLRREWLLAVRNPGQWMNPVIFFLIVVTLFPIGIGPSPETLSTIAPGVLWVCALLAVMLSLDSLFGSDFQDGTLEQLVLSGQSVALMVLSKCIVHWLLNGIPLLLLSPLLAVLMSLDTAAIPVLMVSLSLGTLTLSLLGGIGAALTLGLNHAGVLLSLLVLPLTVPVLIFGSAAVAAAATGLPAAGQLLIMLALLLLALSLAPLAIAMALRISVSGTG